MARRGHHQQPSFAVRLSLCFFFFHYFQGLQAASLTPGNLVVVRVGNGVDNIVGSANPAFLDEYLTNGTLVQSLPLPTSASGSNFACTLSQTTSEGHLARSADAQLLSLPCYNAVSGQFVTNGNSIRRTVAIVNASGAIDTTTSLTDFTSLNNAAAAVTSDGTSIWVSATGKLRYTTRGKSTSTGLLDNSKLAVLSLHIIDGQLYGSGGSSVSSSTQEMYKVGTGLPKSSTSQNPLPGVSTRDVVTDFALLNLDGTTGVDTLYFADNDATTGSTTFVKYILNTTVPTWVKQSYGLALSQVLAIAFDPDTTSYPVTLYLTTPTKLLKVIDDGKSMNQSTLASADLAKKAFRGISYAPGPVPRPVVVSPLLGCPTGQFQVGERCFAQLEASLVVSPLLLQANQTATVQVFISNRGPTIVSNHTLSLYLCPGLNLTSLTPSFNYTPSSTEANTLIVQVNQPIAAYSSLRVLATVQVASGTPSGSQLIVEAAATYLSTTSVPFPLGYIIQVVPTTPQQPSNSTCQCPPGQFQLGPKCLAQLQVSILDTPASVLANKTATVQVLVKNKGLTTVNNYTLSLLLGTGLSLTSLTPSFSYTTSPSTHTVAVDITQPLAPVASRIVQATLQVASTSNGTTLAVEASTTYLSTTSITYPVGNAIQIR